MQAALAGGFWPRPRCYPRSIGTPPRRRLALLRRRPRVVGTARAPGAAFRLLVRTTAAEAPERPPIRLLDTSSWLGGPERPAPR